MQYPTIRQLAEHLDTSILNKGVVHGYNPVVPLQVTGSGVPIFFVHPGVGEVLIFVNLAKYFANERPFYALRARGFDNNPYFESMEEMADIYTAAIRKTQPKGPQAVAGYSYGGVVAFEIAKRLEAQGEKMAFVGLVNIPPHIKPRMLELDWTGGFLNLSYFLDLITKEEATRVSPYLHTLPREEQINHIWSKASPDRIKELEIDRTQLENYEPSGTVAQVSVLYAIPLAGKKEDWLDGMLMKWDGFTRQANSYIGVPGAHYTLMNHHYVPYFQKYLKAGILTREHGVHTLANPDMSALTRQSVYQAVLERANSFCPFYSQSFGMKTSTSNLVAYKEIPHTLVPSQLLEDNPGFANLLEDLENNYLTPSGASRELNSVPSVEQLTKCKKSYFESLAIYQELVQLLQDPDEALPTQVHQAVRNAFHESEGHRYILETFPENCSLLGPSGNGLTTSLKELDRESVRENIVPAIKQRLQRKLDEVTTFNSENNELLLQDITKQKSELEELSINVHQKDIRYLNYLETYQMILRSCIPPLWGLLENYKLRDGVTKQVATDDWLELNWDHIGDRIRLLQAETEAEIYNPKIYKCLVNIRQNLTDASTAVHKSIKQGEAQLQQYSLLGEEFQRVLKNYQAIQERILKIMDDIKTLSRH
ncbi:alpha/beta-hydrolase [Basidiobolus meristosporus CBS 931.73]|uniref:Alpha/beta-hydrolase n=1 Tax=Basidiobolus meristosporus CBS 931.73 TaxID=1314790 RepID=A0A1Y1YPJ9_9FUNG|nr:alpha/beta-hydrolase [Basidiobolus meristosporus CBS 931.73]|eukprot:ORX99753.1 alpha/beta-hydrolase [Basidiobolus meristosporus CBS 931.73]